MTVEELFPARPHRSTNREVTDDEKLKFLNSLEEYGDAVGFSWLLRKEPSHDTAVDLPDVEDMLFSENYLSSTNKEEYLKNMLAVSHKKMCAIAKDTIEQIKSPKWIQAKKNRLTSSNFGAILECLGRQEQSSRKIPVSLFRWLTSN